MIWKQKKADIIRCFRAGNVTVAGHKGSGKDLLFSWVIRTREKAGEIHASNVKYTEKTHIRHPSYYQLKNNNMDNFIFGNFEREQMLFTEREDYYLSEAGLALPSWDRSTLERKFPTMPIVFALSRHLGEFNIHSNAQDFTKIWDKLRFHSDYFIWCEKAFVLFNRFEYHRIVLYDRAETAYEHIQPFKVRGWFIFKNKHDREYAQQFNAKYGTIKRICFWCKHPKESYDTRDFYKKLYKHEPPFIHKKKNKKYIKESQ